MSAVALHGAACQKATASASGTHANTSIIAAPGAGKHIEFYEILAAVRGGAGAGVGEHHVEDSDGTSVGIVLEYDSANKYSGNGRWSGCHRLPANKGLQFDSTNVGPGSPYPTVHVTYRIHTTTPT